jgi:hypothetical protein
MSNNFFTNIAAGIAARANVNTALGQLDSAITNFRDGVNAFVQINFGATSTLTLNASGVITVTRTRHRVDTLAAAATDDLETISGQTDGDELFLQIVSASLVVVVKHNTGNIFLAAQADFSFSSTSEVLHLIYDGTTSKWCEAQTRTTLVTAPYIRVEDQKAKNTHGGASTNTTWHTRTLNTEVTDTGGYASVASNQVTLAAGTYDIVITAPAYASSIHAIVLRNDTDGTIAIFGPNEDASSADTSQTRARAQGRITIAATKAFSIRHYISVGQATFGLGVALNVNDPDGAARLEVYSTFEAWKVG